MNTSRHNVAEVLTRTLAFAKGIARGAATPVELARSVLSPDLKRGFPKYYRARRRIVAANGIAVWMFAQNRRARAVASLGVGTLAASLAWKSRSDWGVAGGLPPGRVLTGSRAVHDPDHFFSAASRYGSVFKTNHFDEPAVCLIGMADAAQLFREQHESLDVVPLAFNQFVPGGLVRWKEGQAHDEYRRLFQQVFGQHLIRSNERVLEASADRMLDNVHQLSLHGDVSPAHHLPGMVFEAWAELFFGIAPTAPLFAEVSDLYDTIDVSKLHDPERMICALERLEQVLQTVGANDGDCALNILRSRIGDPHLEPSMIRNLIFTLDMTRTDVAGLMQWALFHAATNSGVLDALAEEAKHGPASTDTHSLANRMVSETLRLEQSEHLFRRTREELRVGRYRAPPGWLVRVCTQESHRDPSLFPDPDRYDPDRFLRPTWKAAAYAPFGIDGHSCIGEALTRRFTSTLLVRLALRFHVEVTNGGTRQMSEHQHWSPGDFRLRLTPRN